MKSRIHLSDWLDSLAAQGRYTFTRSEAESAAEASFVATQSALRRMKQKGRLASPRRGFYVLVPPEYRAAGSLPAAWFIDDMMRFCHCRYYVGLLSAAALHGAAHQQPMVFQVLTDSLNATMQVGRVRVQAMKIRSVDTASVQRIQTETGTMAVSTPETTAFDLVRHSRVVGSWSSVGTVLAELAEKLHRDRLVEAAAHGRLPDAQRLGYLLDLLGQSHLTTPLAEWLASQRTTIVALRPEIGTDGVEVDRRWRLLPNEVVETDL